MRLYAIMFAHLSLTWKSSSHHLICLTEWLKWYQSWNTVIHLYVCAIRLHLARRYLENWIYAKLEMNLHNFFCMLICVYEDVHTWYLSSFSTFCNFLWWKYLVFARNNKKINDPIKWSLFHTRAAKKTTSINLNAMRKIIFQEGGETER